ncbi:MAG: AAA-like domain-containing protein [Blastocatellia bacterium]
MKYEFEDFTFDVETGALMRSGGEVKLTRKLRRLLKVLIEHRGQLLDNDRLRGLMWPGKDVDPANVTVSIYELRQALDCEGVIANEPGQGYRFVAKVREHTAHDGRPIWDGALPTDSIYYLVRDSDEAFYNAIEQRRSIVLVKGARQVGKTSLLARGLERARESGAMVVSTDLQALSKDDFASAENLLLALGDEIADELRLETTPHDVWSNLRGSNANFKHYLSREVLGKTAKPLVWALDEVDCLFEFDYASEIFGLFRSWHNARATHPLDPWHNLTMVIAYATEAHLFITDQNQSPFNVGLRFSLDDFTLDQVAELNRRHSSPLKDQDELVRLFDLVGGHPYLVQHALCEMAERGLEVATIEATAGQDIGIFGSHLRRMLDALKRNPTLCEAVRGILRGDPQSTPDDFYHLRSAGVLIGNSVEDARIRCTLYLGFLSKHLL